MRIAIARRAEYTQTHATRKGRHMPVTSAHLLHLSPSQHISGLRDFARGRRPLDGIVETFSPPRRQPLLLELALDQDR
jgi:hypothetical protein